MATTSTGFAQKTQNKSSRKTHAEPTHIRGRNHRVKSIVTKTASTALLATSLFSHGVESTPSSKANDVEPETKIKTLVLATSNDNSIIPVTRSDLHDKDDYASDDGETYSLHAGLRFTEVKNNDRSQTEYSINFARYTELGHSPFSAEARNYRGRGVDVANLKASKSIEKLSPRGFKYAFSGSASFFGVGDFGGLKLQKGWHKATPFVNTRFERYSDLLESHGRRYAMENGLQDVYNGETETGVDLSLKFRFSAPIKENLVVAAEFGAKSALGSYGERRAAAALQLTHQSRPDSRIGLALIQNHIEHLGDYLDFYPEREGTSTKYRLNWDKLLKKSSFSVYVTGVLNGEGASSMLLSYNRNLGNTPMTWNSRPIIENIHF